MAVQQGDIAYRGASAWLRLPPGTSGHFLKTQGTGANPVWAAATGAGGGAVAVEKIEEQTPSATGTLTFSSLGSYTHLMMHYTARSDKAGVNAEDVLIRFNGDTGANYDVGLVYNSAATTAAAFEQLAGTSGIISTIPAATATADRAAGGSFRILDYRGTTFNKVVTGESIAFVNTATFASPNRSWGVGWRSTAAITSITLFLGTGNFIAGSKFSLYGYN